MGSISYASQFAGDSQISVADLRGLCLMSDIVACHSHAVQAGLPAMCLAPLLVVGCYRKCTGRCPSSELVWATVAKRMDSYHRERHRGQCGCRGQRGHDVVASQELAKAAVEGSCSRLCSLTAEASSGAQLSTSTSGHAASPLRFSLSRKRP